jgi:hypothetical protein
LLISDPEYTGDPAATLTVDISDLQNPTATLNTATTGTYIVKLAVSDGTTPVEKVIAVEVYADACLAQQNAPSGWTVNYFDTNVDCIVSFVDFADLAGNWLDDRSMTVQEIEVRVVTPITADIAVDEFNVYTPADPNFAADYVTNPPLDFSVANPRFGRNDDRIGGTYLRNTAATNFVTYEIVVPEAGSYTVTVNSSKPGGNLPSIAFGTNADVDAYGQFALTASTSWSMYVNDTGTVTFPSAGTHLVRVTWIDDAFNLDYILFDKD